MSTSSKIDNVPHGGVLKVRSHSPDHLPLITRVFYLAMCTLGPRSER